MIVTDKEILNPSVPDLPSIPDLLSKNQVVKKHLNISCGGVHIANTTP